MPCRLPVLWLLLVLLAMQPRLLRAHDLWMEPSVYFTPRGQEVTITLPVGERGQPEEVKPMRREDMMRFGLFSGHRPTQDLLGKLPHEGDVPSVSFKADGGNVVLAMERTPKRLDLDGEKFTHYLTEEGQIEALAHRNQAGQNGQPSRERYRRYLKTLVQDSEVSSRPAVLYRRRFGQRLEILLENNPGRLRPGQLMRVRVLFEGRPLSGARVTALHRPRPDAPADRTLTATTDTGGRANFPPLDANGPWLVRLVYVRPVAPGAGPAGPQDVDWESFWAAYAFGVRMLPPTPTPTAGTPAPRRGEDGH